MRRDAPPASLLSTLPWLLDANSWTLESGPHEPESADERGVWPVGNGWIFAHAGLATPLNRLCGLVGPGYQTEAAYSITGAFGDCWIELAAAAGHVTLPWQEIWRPRESGVLVTRGHANDGPAVVTIDCAPPGRPLIMRLVEVWGGDRLGADGRVLVQLPAGFPHDERRRSLAARGGPGRLLMLGVVVAGREALPGRIVVPLAGVPRQGGVQRLLVLIACGATERDVRESLVLAFDPVTVLEDTRGNWQNWLARTRTPELWPQNFAGPSATARGIGDLIEITKVNLKMQQAQPSGAVSPMVHHKGVWARDSVGPIRAFLAMGARAEAQQILEYCYRAAIVLGRIPASAPLDLDTAGVGEPDDWSAIGVPPTTAPSLVILQHRWWVEAGGDVELVRRHWAYLRRCATGQPRASADGWLPFDGDETYLHGALYAIFPDRVGWPNDLIGDDASQGYAARSLDAMVTAVVAQEAMAWLCGRVGHDAERRGYEEEAALGRAAIEHHFWMEDRGHYAPAVYPLTGARHEAPFAPINLRPLWLGYQPPDDPRARANLDAVLEMVGFSGTTPNCEFMVGHTPGYLLWDLLAVESPLAPLALANLVGLASPAGDWAEVHGPGGRPHTGYDTDMPNRLRPSEGGVNLDAIYRYYAVRRPEDEPEGDLSASIRHRRTRGSGPFRAFQPSEPAPPGRVVLITADASEVEAARREPSAAKGAALTVIEAALPVGPEWFERLLFDPATGARRVDLLLLGASALAGDRRSMKPVGFWQLPRLTSVLTRFEDAGGRLVRGHH